MLVLTRKPQESIMIGDDIEVIVASIDRNSVRIGIRAPRDIKILRKETIEEVRAENLRAIEAAAKYTDGFNDLISSESDHGKAKPLQDSDKKKSSGHGR